MRDLRDYHAFVLDLDGVVYRGDLLLPGAIAFVEWLDAHHRPLIFLSNNSMSAPDEVAAKLERLGVPGASGRVLTSGEAAAQLIAKRFPGGSVYVLGLPPIERMAELAGLRPVWRDGEPLDGPPPDAVLVALDRSLTYGRLSRALRALLAGAAFVAVNRDPRLPVQGAIEPGTGSLVAALEASSGRVAEIVGKPAPAVVFAALERMGAQPADALMIGDGLDIDIIAGHAAGVDTALVLTGLNSAEEAEVAQGARRPEHVYADLAELLGALMRQTA